MPRRRYSRRVCRVQDLRLGLACGGFDSVGARRDARLSNTTQTPHEPALLLPVRHGVSTAGLQAWFGMRRVRFTVCPHASHVAPTDETRAFPTLHKPLTSLHSCYDTVSALELHHAGQIGSSALAPAPRACISAGIRNANADTPAPSAHAFAAPRAWRALTTAGRQPRQGPHDDTGYCRARCIRIK